MVKAFTVYTVMISAIMLWYSYELYQKDHINVSMILIATATGLACLVAYKIAKYSAEVAGHENTIVKMFEGNKPQLTNTLLKHTEEKIPPILYVSNDKVYEIPRPKIDQWAKSDPVLRIKLEKIINKNSLRATTNFHLLPEDRHALGMHILLDIGQEVCESVYPHAINQAIASMGKDAFEKEYYRQDLKLKDLLEGNPDMHYITGD